MKDVTVGFSVYDVNISEGNSTTIQVVLDRAVEITFSVNVTVDNLTGSTITGIPSFIPKSI